MFQQRCNMFPSDSQVRSFMTLFTARAGSAACVIIGKMATATKRQNNTTKTTQSHLSDKTPTLIHPGYRVASLKLWKLSWILHDCRDWSFQDTTARNSAALPSIPFLHTLQNPGQIQGDGEWTSSWNETSYSLNHIKSRSVHRTWRVNLELNKISYSLNHSNPLQPTMQISFQDQVLSRFYVPNWVNLSDSPGLSAPKQP